MTDERQVDCAMRRIEIERQRASKQLNRAWVRRTMDRAGRTPG